MKTILININGEKVPINIEIIKSQIACNPSWHRTRLSKELCQDWEWFAPNGQLKDMACRKMLLKLERTGQITLPPLRRESPNSKRNHSIKQAPHIMTPIECDLNVIRPLKIIKICERSEESALFNYLLSKYHYLSFRNAAGANVKYLIKSNTDVPLGCALFSSAAWKTQSRDIFIGWNQQQREQNLNYIANNARFLILPWVTVPNLASHILSAISKRIKNDWLLKYETPIYLLETFVDRDRFLGTCYQAANWYHSGHTQGRTRNDSKHRIQTSIKDVYLYPLIKNFRQRLSDGC